MKQNLNDSETARPEDDWGLSLEEQHVLAEERARRARVIRPAPPKAAPPAMALPRAGASAPTSVPGAHAALLPHRGKLDQFPAFATRSALFCASKHASALPQNTPLKSQGTYALRAGGPRLDMRDKAVWEAAIGMAKEFPDPSQEIPINLSELSRRIGQRDANGAALTRVWKSLERLAQADVELTLQGKVHAGKMLAAATFNGSSRSIRLDFGLCALVLESDAQFKINSVRRHSLSSALAQWLHDFFSTHSAYGAALTLGYLRELCGFDGQTRRFPKLLDVAMAELATKAPQLVTGHRISKVGRSSEKWTLNVDRGPEAPVFTKARANIASPSFPTAPKPRQPKKWLAL